VRARREPEDEHAGVRVAESRNRLAPVFGVAVRTAFFARDLLAPGDEPRAAMTRGDVAIQFRERDRELSVFDGHRGRNAR
jgi:hypothetical protein